MQENSMRPMDIGSIIDRTFKLYRNNFSSFILFSLLIGGTATLIISLANLGAGAFNTNSALGSLYSGLADGESFLDAFSEFSAASQSGSPVLSTVLSLLMSVFVTPFVTGGIVVITLSACNVRNGESGGYFSQVKKIYPKLIGTQFAMTAVAILFFIVLMIPVVIILVVVAIGSAGSGSGVAYIITVIVVVLAVVLATVFSIPFFWLIFPVAIHENKFGFKPVGRTWSLFRRKFWKSIGLVLLTSIMIYALSAVVGIIVAFLPPILNVILTTAITALLTPVSYIAVTLLYLDIRMTVEGYDLELRSAAMKSAAIAEIPGNMSNPEIAVPVQSTDDVNTTVTTWNTENTENTENANE